MKKITKLIVVVAFILGGTATYAQDVLVVAPGKGTLNAAIAANQGNKIYQLQAGKFYQLNALIENVGYHLQIIGEVPANGGKPATLQTNGLGTDIYAKMFNALGDVTLKNVYFVNSNFNGEIAPDFMVVNGINAKIVVDNIVLDPVGLANGFKVLSTGVSISLTNSLIMNHGVIASPNDGHFFNNAGVGSGFEKLFVENNTFVAMGTTMHHGGYNKNFEGQITWNHNTWVMQKSQLDWSSYEDGYVFTNNLMFDFNTQPWSRAWLPNPDGDAAAPNTGLIHASKYPDETLPSVRQQFIQYNNLTRNPGFYTMLDELNVINASDGVANLIYMPLVYGPEFNMSNPDPKLRSKEAILFENKVDFPEWKYGNTTALDPQFEDAKIYAHSDNFVLWTKPATLMHAMGKTGVPPSTEWAKWHWDEDGDIGNNATWPVFNGVYTNPAMLTASIESLPLGDLNWFPEAKAIWLNNKAAIDAHIAAGNTNKIEMSLAVNDFTNLEKFGFSFYPNPVNNELKLTAKSKISEITVYNLLGQEVLRKTLNSTSSSLNVTSLKSGLYLAKVVIDNTVGTFKIIKE